MKKILSDSIKKTHDCAAQFAKSLKGGEIFGLVGDLGSGKTTFVQGVARALKIKSTITSPTFVILREYQISDKRYAISHKLNSLVHIDLYRIESFADAESAGIFDYLGKADKVCFVEWADKIKNDLPKNTNYIKFKFINKNTREIKGEI
jgi:tRNA threonylcarbamoyladenosine biosynthesis protein TsaE